MDNMLTMKEYIEQKYDYKIEIGQGIICPGNFEFGLPLATDITDVYFDTENHVYGCEKYGNCKDCWSMKIQK
jgi:hypothetical protein